MQKKSLTKSQLASLYGVHINTLAKWIKSIPILLLNKRQRKLTPKQVEIIVKHLGEP